MKPIQFPSLKARFLNHGLLFGKKVAARILSCNEARSYQKQSVLQSSFTHWHVFLLPVIPQKRSQQLVTGHGEKHQELAQLTEVTLLLHHRVSTDFSLDM